MAVLVIEAMNQIILFPFPSGDSGDPKYKRHWWDWILALLIVLLLIVIPTVLINAVIDWLK